MKTDARLLFIIKAIHCVSECDETLDSDEIKGLQSIIESIVIDGREKP